MLTLFGEVFHGRIKEQSKKSNLMMCCRLADSDKEERESKSVQRQKRYRYGIDMV